ncbi:unnamed protein product, partial [Sphagnum jensenii]
MTQEQHTTLVVSLHIYGDDEAQKKQKENWRYVWVVKLPLQAPYSTWTVKERFSTPSFGQNNPGRSNKIVEPT